jgi:hypothetical protein
MVLFGLALIAATVTKAAKPGRFRILEPILGRPVV